jgi:hypothetical protein
MIDLRAFGRTDWKKAKFKWLFCKKDIMPRITNFYSDGVTKKLGLQDITHSKT